MNLYMPHEVDLLPFLSSYSDVPKIGYDSCGVSHYLVSSRCGPLGGLKPKRTVSHTVNVTWTPYS